MFPDRLELEIFDGVNFAFDFLDERDDIFNNSDSIIADVNHDVNDPFNLIDDRCNAGGYLAKDPFRD
jgi:hypothetical protein